MNKFATHDNAGRIPSHSEDTVLTFDSLDEKARWLDAASSLDSLRDGLRKAVARFLPIQSAEQRTREIQRYVRDRIHYVADWRVSNGQPGEELADSESILRRGYDDCDGKARLFVALVRAAEMARPLGTVARIRPIFKKHPLEFVHVQAEARWPGSARLPYAEAYDGGGWVLVETILKGCEIGQNPDDCPRGPKGERLIT